MIELLSGGCYCSLQEATLGAVDEQTGEKENEMQTQHSKSSRNGMNGRQRLKSRIGGSRKNGYVHVAKPAMATEIQRTLGIKRIHIANMMRAFAAAGVKV